MEIIHNAVFHVNHFLLVRTKEYETDEGCNLIQILAESRISGFWLDFGPGFEENDQISGQTSKSESGIWESVISQ